MPARYFVAKPRRAVYFDEVATAIIPDNSSAELKKALEDGKTKVASTGESINIKNSSVQSINDNGTMTLKSEGQTVNTSDIEYADEDDALVFETVAKAGYDTHGANAVIHLWNASKGTVSATDFLLGIDNAIKYGEMNYSLSAVKDDLLLDNLTESQKQFGFDIGRDIAKRKENAKNSSVNKSKTGKTVNKGKVTLPVDYNSLTERQKVSVSTVGNVVSTITHNNVVFFESVRKEDGTLVLKKDVPALGRKAGDTAPNGYYYQDGTIYIDINAGQSGEGTILFTAAHELTHFISQWSPTKFVALADFVISKYAEKGVSVRELVARQQAKYKANNNGEEQSFDAAYEEVVADSMESMFTDTNLAARLAELKQTDRTLWQKIKDWFNSLIKRIKSEYAGYEPNTYEGRLVKSWTDALERISQLFEEGLREAGENYQQTTQEGIKDVKFSDRDTDYSEYDKPITERDIETLRSIGRKSVNDFSSEDIKKAQKWAYKFYKQLGTRSPFFRAWFGDWRQYDKKIIKIVDVMASAGMTSGNAFCDELNSKISWSSGLRQESTIHSSKNNKEDVSILACNIKGLLKNTVLLDSEISQNTAKSKMQDTEFMHSLYSLARINNRVVLAKLYVEEAFSAKANEDFFRAYDIKYIKKVAEFDDGVLSEYGGLTESHSTTDYSVADLYSFVKTYDKDFVAGKPVNPALLNDDGTPRVFYHGINAKFNVFSLINKGNHGDMLGVGYYFVNDKAEAQRYGDVREFYLSITKTISSTKLTITKDEYNSYLKYAEKNKNKYINGVWKGNTLDIPSELRSMDYEDNDVGLISRLINTISAGNADVAHGYLRMLKDSIGYDGCIVNVRGNKVAVAFNPNQIKWRIQKE